MKTPKVPLLLPILVAFAGMQSSTARAEVAASAGASRPTFSDYGFDTGVETSTEATGGAGKEGTGRAGKEGTGRPASVDSVYHHEREQPERGTASAPAK